MNLFSQNQQGVVLITTVLFTTLIASLGFYLLAATLAENRIAHSHAHALQAYYVAEAGTEQAIWLLDRNETYQENFQTNPSWTTEFSVTDLLAADTSYTVTIANQRTGYADITATGYADITADTQARRVAAMVVFRAWGQTSMGTNALYVDEDITISTATLNIPAGDLFDNGALTINLDGSATLAGHAKIVGDVAVSFGSDFDVSGTIYAETNDPPGAPASLEMPAIDFDSIATTSLKNLANATYTEAEFEDLMWNNQELTLNNGITYVVGDVTIRGGQDLTLNGLLVVDNNLTIGTVNCWEARCGANTIIITHTAEQPSGIMTKGSLAFGEYLDEVSIAGLLYVNDTITIEHIPAEIDFVITGGMAGRTLSLLSSLSPLTVSRDNAIMVDTLQASAFSPVISIEHWEEAY